MESHKDLYAILNKSEYLTKAEIKAQLMPCAHLHHKCICVVVSRFLMVRYSQKGKEEGLELKECYKKRKTYAAFREYGSELFIY